MDKDRIKHDLNHNAVLQLVTLYDYNKAKTVNDYELMDAKFKTMQSLQLQEAELKDMERNA